MDGVDEFYGTPALSRVRDYSADGVLRSLEDSLRRLRLDRVDIALIHDPDEHLAEALDGAYPALARLRADGVVGAIGVGVNSASLAEWFVSRCDLDCVLVAGRYTLLGRLRGAVAVPAVPGPRGVAVLAAGVFNSGILADPSRRHPLRLRPGPARPAGPGPPHRRGVRPLRRPGGGGGPALRPAAPCGHRCGGRRAHPGEIRADAGYLSLVIPDALWADLADLRP